MCGIAGAVGHGLPRNEAEAAVGAAVRALEHRGPDAAGTWADAHAALGAARLAVRDVPGGAQPMRAPSGKVLVYNGELYDAQRWRAALASRCWRARTGSDTEVVLGILDELGEAALSELDGMFALGLWDPGRRSLLLARDRWGEKPLYYAALDAGGLAFSSEPDALRPWSGVDWTRDDGAVHLLLTHGYLPGVTTGWRRVRKLLPGEVLRWSPAAVRTRRYFVPPRPPARAEAAHPDLDEAADELGERLDESVRRRLRADRPVGLLLSGGVDSSTVLALAARRVPGVPAWTLGWEERDYDESTAARCVAKHLNVPLTVVRCSPADLVERLDDLLDGYGEPFADESLLPTALVCEAAAREVRVVLTGDGGDELFGGYERYLHPSASHEYASIFAACPRPTLGRLVEADALREADPFQPVTRPLDEAAGLDAVSARRWADLHTYLPGDILTKVDRASMRFGLESRAPFLGQPVGSWAVGLPPGLVCSGSRSKVVLRRLASRWLPREVAEGPKRGFGVPLVHWFRGPLAGWLRERLSGGGLERCAALRPGAWRALIDEHQGGRANHARVLFTLVVLERWLSRAALG